MTRLLDTPYFVVAVRSGGKLRMLKKDGQLAVVVGDLVLGIFEGFRKERRAKLLYEEAEISMGLVEV